MNFGEISEENQQTTEENQQTTEENQQTTEEFLFISFLFSLFTIIRLPQHFIAIHNLY